MALADDKAKQRHEGSFATEVAKILRSLGVSDSDSSGGSLAVRSPIDGSQLAAVREASNEEATAAVGGAEEAFLAWRDVPAPRRGELVRRLGEELRENKATLARLITFETGKITSEGLGEVQEMIDICDFAVGLSRQLYGYRIASERPGHAMREMWHPLGVVGCVRCHALGIVDRCRRQALGGIGRVEMARTRSPRQNPGCGCFQSHERPEPCHCAGPDPSRCCLR